MNQQRQRVLGEQFRRETEQFINDSWNDSDALWPVVRPGVPVGGILYLDHTPPGGTEDAVVLPTRS